MVIAPEYASDNTASTDPTKYSQVADIALKGTDVGVRLDGETRSTWYVLIQSGADGRHCLVLEPSLALLRADAFDEIARGDAAVAHSLRLAPSVAKAAASGRTERGIDGEFPNVEAARTR